MNTTRAWRMAALLLALALVASACRGGDGGDDDVSLDEEGGAAVGETDDADDAEDDPDADVETEAGDGEEVSDEEGEQGDITFDVGVTEEPCPNAVNDDNGCIYLGTLSDLSQGPFAALGPSITEAQEAFWRTVNEDGGIGGQFDVNVTEFVRDSLYNPEVHNQLFQEIKGNVLALAQTLGSPPTAAIIDDLKAENVVAAPASWSSEWLYEDVILESGNNYCVESMNAIDYALDEIGLEAESVMSVYYPGDYGGDAAAGVEFAAGERGLEYIDVATQPGQDNQGGAIQQVVSQQPDILIVTTGPTDLATIVGQAVAQGYEGQVIGTSPTWNPGLLDSPAAPALEAVYLQSGPWATYATDTPGHERMREAIGIEDGDDGLTSGWVWSYPLLAVLEQAAENGDLTREGVVAAISDVEEVDYEGFLPEGAGNFAGEDNEQTVRGTVFSAPDTEASTGVSLVTEDFYFGPTAEAYEFDGPCFQ